jgi:HAE1 family hydrophobic/amphiphilic exporter-1
LQYNLVLKNARLDIQSAEAELEATQGIYDELLGASVTYEDSELPSPEFPVQGATKTLFVGGRLGRRFGLGTEVDVVASSGRIDFEQLVSEVNPLHVSSLTLGVAQPLWRDAGGDSDKIRTRVAELNRDRVALGFVQERDTVAARIQLEYWDAYAASRQYLVNQEALKRATELLEINRTWQQDGLLDETDILAAEAALAERDVDVLNLKNASLRAQDRLRESMHVPREEWSRVEFAFPEPGELVTSKIIPELEEATRVAMTNRVELAVLASSLRQAREVIRLREESMKGDLSLNGRVGVGESAADWGDSIRPEKTLWGVGLELVMPLERTAERSELRQARLEVERVLNEQENTARAIGWDVRRLWRDLDTARERVAATRKASGLQKRKLALEYREFEQGRSTTRTIVEYQDDLAFSELSAVLAEARYHEAWVRFELARGTLLDKQPVYQALGLTGMAEESPR